MLKFSVGVVLGLAVALAAVLFYEPRKDTKKEGVPKVSGLPRERGPLAPTFYGAARNAAGDWELFSEKDITFINDQIRDL